jgi:hypothetical protein
MHLFFILFLASCKIEFDDFLLPKELIFNTISIVHLQSTLMIMASERDFPFNISSDSKLNYIRYPQSYRTTLLQVSSNMHDVFSNIYSTMYRIQLAVKRIPDYIKTILKLILAGSSTMIKKMLPIYFNNIARISNENQILMKKIIDQLVNLFNLFNEIKQLPIDLSLKFNNYPSVKTDLILYNKFDSKNVLEKICLKIQQMKKQFEQMVELIINLDIKTKFNLSLHDDLSCFIPVLYMIENNAYFFYQVSSIYTSILNRYVLDQTAGMGRYLVLSTDEERFTTLSKLSQELSNMFDDVEKLFNERQNEFEISNIALQEVYEKLFDEFEDRSSRSNVLERK